MATPFVTPPARALLLGLVLLPASVAILAVPAVAAKAKPVAHAVVPFIDDDLDRALAEAKQRELPLFIESWAPW